MDLALNKQQWLMCHKTKLNQTLSIYDNNHYTQHVSSSVSVAFFNDISTFMGY